MIVTHAFKMDLVRRKSTERIDVVQDDKYSRNLEISLYSDGDEWQLEQGTSAVVSYVKQDGTGGRYNFLPDETPAWYTKDNRVTVALAPQVCTVPGRVKLSVGLIKDREQISTFMFELEVHRIPGLQVTSEDYYKVSGTLPNFGWDPGMLLGTDAKGNVVSVEPPETGIHTINGVGPDESGDIRISISAMPLPASARAGQYFRAKSVDADGKVTAVEAVDLASETNAAAYLYNGVELPALPEWDTAAYPYALIEQNTEGTTATLYASDKPLGFLDKGDLVGDVLCAEGEAYYAVQYGYLRLSGEDITDFAFQYSIDEAPWLSMSRESVLWANHDVMDWDAGDMLLAASEPVPVAEPDSLTLALAKEYTDSQRIAYAESNTITFDGNFDDKEIVVFEEDTEAGTYWRMVKISDEPVQFTQDTLKRIGISISEGESAGDIDADMAEVMVYSTEGEIIANYGDIYTEGEKVLIYSLENEVKTEQDGEIIFYMPRGTWVADVKRDDWTFCVASFTYETVHQIAPKYIPLGGGFPVITLTTKPGFGSFTEMTAQESAQLNAAAAMGLPCVVRIDNGNGTYVSGIGVCAHMSSGMAICTVPLYTHRTTETGAPYYVFLHLELAVGAENWTASLGHWSTNDTSD